MFKLAKIMAELNGVVPVAELTGAFRVCRGPPVFGNSIEKEKSEWARKGRNWVWRLPESLLPLDEPPKVLVAMRVVKFFSTFLPQ